MLAMWAFHYRSLQQDRFPARVLHPYKNIFDEEVERRAVVSVHLGVWRRIDGGQPDILIDVGLERRALGDLHVLAVLD